MWPKMLLEFLPHLTRLIPAADNYLSSRKQSDQAQAAAFTALGDEVRGEFSNVAEEQTALRRELQAHIAASAQIGVDAARARIGVENLDARLTSMESRLTNVLRLLWAALAALGLALILIFLRAFR
jgi:beta-lactamase regulating signal transducer with metallopeptidase domain